MATLREHWRAFWRSGLENIYTFIWWGILGAIVSGTLYVGSSLLDVPSKWEDRFLSAFVALLLVVVLATLQTLYRRRNAGLAGAARQPEPSPVVELRLSVGRMTAGFEPIKKDGYIQFTITVFPCPQGLKLESQPSGKVHYKERLLSPDGSSELGEQATLDAPQLDPDSGFANHGLEGTWIMLRQYVPLAIRDSILEALNRPDPALEFDFDDLVVMVSSASGSEPQRLPLWNGLNCRKGICFGQIKKAVGKA